MESNKIIKKVVATSLALILTTASVSPVFAYSKDETVYTKINNSGETIKTTVSEHLQNTEQNQTLKDLSELLGITNVNGDEKFNQNGENLEWEANSNDIYYQGNTDKELPLDCSIKYELDGNEISPNDLIGKSGKVKISLEYKNKEAHIINVNGTDTTMYTPFVVVTGTVMDNEKVKNVKITNGKVVDNGKKTLVLGITCPGLKESLGLENNDKIDFEIPEKIEMEFDAQDFEMENIISYATPKVLDNDDIINLDKLDSLYSDVSTLSDSSKQLVVGTNALKEGTNTLEKGAQTLDSGVLSAYNGSSQIQSQVKQAINNLKADNSDALDANTITQIGAQAAIQAQLSSSEKEAIGAQAASQASSQIQSQKSAIEAKASAEAKKTVESEKSSIKKLAVSQAQLTTTQQQSLEKVMEDYLAKNPVYDSLTQAQQEGLLQTILPALIGIVQNSIDTTAGETAYGTAVQISQDTASTTASTTAGEVAGSVANTTAQTVAEQTAIQAAKQTAKQTASQVANEVKRSAQNSVISQMGALETGLSSLTSGLSEIKTGTSSLVSGTSTLNEGAQTLATGMATFDNEGIQKIADAVNGDVKDLQTRVEKLKDLAKEYNTFAGKDENSEGTVKFIFLIDSLKKDKENSNTTEAVISGNTLVTNNDNKNTTNETSSK